MTEEMPQAGWYVYSQDNPGRLRYWDGAQWTEQYQDVPVSGQTQQPTPIQYAQPVTPVQPVMQQTQYGQVPGTLPVKDTSGLALASMIIGIVGPFAAVVALFGYVCGVLALVFGVRGLKSRRRGMAIAGIILGIVTLIFSLASSAIGVMTMMSGNYF